MSSDKNINGKLLLLKRQLQKQTVSGQQDWQRWKKCHFWGFQYSNQQILQLAGEEKETSPRQILTNFSLVIAEAGLSCRTKLNKYWKTWKMFQMNGDYIYSISQAEYKVNSDHGLSSFKST